MVTACVTAHRDQTDLRIVPPSFGFERPGFLPTPEGSFVSHGTISMMAARLVQYVVIRRDLIDVLSWPNGAVIAQACHACTAAIHMFYSEDCTQKYLNDLERMHKVILEAKDKDSLLKLSDCLLENGVDHKLWVEQPENFPTCIATKPYPKTDIEKFFKKFKLYK